MVGRLILARDIAHLQTLFNAEDDIVGDLGFETGNFDNAESAECGTDNISRETEVYRILVRIECYEDEEG